MLSVAYRPQKADIFFTKTQNWVVYVRATARSRSGDVAKGHHLSDKLRTTLTHPSTIDRCPFKGLCSSKQ